MVEDGVIVLMVALRSGKICHFIGYGFCVRNNCATGDAHLCVTIDIADLCRSRLFVHHKRTKVHAGGCVRLVEFPVQRINGYSILQNRNTGNGDVCSYVLGPLSMLADNNTRVGLASRILHVRISIEVVFRDGVTYSVCGNHAFIVFRMLLKVALQYKTEDG